MIADIILFGGCVKSAELIQNIYIKSCSDLFGVRRLSNTFVQKFSTKGFMEALVAVNKEDFVKLEMLKALNMLKLGKEYNANSHLKTVIGLNKLSKDGIVEDFEYIDSGKEKSYAFEKMLIGNLKKTDFKNVDKNNNGKKNTGKHKNYNIKFKKTGKYVTPEYMVKQLKNPEMYKLKKDKDGNIVDVKLDLSKNAIFQVNKVKTMAKATFLKKVDQCKENEGLQMLHKLGREMMNYIKERGISKLKSV